MNDVIIRQKTLQKLYEEITLQKLYEEILFGYSYHR